ncbi:hypothetical protein BDD12DRAFT_984581 [Trichophaea hybrida]|nr:hypothetical protein BDD12DRAFT_984581 [Trichophaea hybrida]
MLEFFHGVQYRDEYDQRSRCGQSCPRQQNPGYTLYWGDLDLIALVKSRLEADDPVGGLRKLATAVSRELRRIKKNKIKDHPVFNVEGIYFLADEYDAFANEYMDPHDPRSWRGTEIESLLKDFCGFISRHVSFEQDFSTVCGLSQSDVLAALKLVYNDEEKVQQCLEELTYYANGYHFCSERTVPTVFNTETAMWYLNDMQFPLQQGEGGDYQKIPYDAVFDNFKLEKLDFYIVVDFKNIEISYLNHPSSSFQEQEEKLTAMSLNATLQLEFRKHDKYRSGTIKQWIDGDVRTQLQSYISGQSIQQNSIGKQFRAYAVAIIESRKILVNEMNRNGDWVENWQLIHETNHEWNRDYKEQ